MKALFLSFVLLTCISLNGNVVKKAANENAVFSDCTDCWAYANEVENHSQKGGFDIWSAAFDDCTEHMNPCADRFSPVVIHREPTTKKKK